MRARVCAAILMAFALAVGCGENSTVAVVNQEPSIRFTFTPLGVPAGFPVDLTVNVSDPNEGDALSVAWTITRGTLTPKNAARTVVTWSVPASNGADTVTVSVSDGEATVRRTEVIKVGTLTTGLGTYIAENSPYILRSVDTPPRIVISGVAVMEAGVEILVDVEGTTIDATAATLNITGEADAPVIIRANDRTLFCGENRGWWQGFVVDTDVTDGVLNMDHAQVWDAVHGVHLLNGGNATITNSTIQCCRDNGVLHEGNGPLVVTDCSIRSGASNGITVETGPTISTPSSVSITNCDISVNGNSGISVDIDDRFGQAPVMIMGNRIQDNDVNGLVMRNWVWPTVEHNAFAFNGGGGASNIRLETSFHGGISPPDTLDFSCNYWGQAYLKENIESIYNTIRDGRDTATIDAVLRVTPWLISTPYNADPIPACDGGL